MSLSVWWLRCMDAMRMLRCTPADGFSGCARGERSFVLAFSVCDSNCRSIWDTLQVPLRSESARMGVARLFDSGAGNLVGAERPRACDRVRIIFRRIRVHSSLAPWICPPPAPGDKLIRAARAASTAKSIAMPTSIYRRKRHLKASLHRRRLYDVKRRRG